MQSPILLLLAGAMLLSGCASIEEARQGRLAGDQEKSEILSALNSSVEAWNQGDLPGHFAIYDKKAAKMTSNGPQATISEMESSLASAYFAPGKSRQHLALDHLVVHPLGDRTAFVTGRFVLSQGAKKAKEKSGWFTLLWRCTHLGWKVIHDHTS